MKNTIAVIGALSCIFFVIAFLVLLFALFKRKRKKFWGISVLVSLTVVIVCSQIYSHLPNDSSDLTIGEISSSSVSESYESSTAEESNTEGLSVQGTETEENLPVIKSDNLIAELMNIGFTEEEAIANREILMLCGLDTISGFEQVDPNATIDGLCLFRNKIDDDRTAIFTVENRKIFYIALNGTDVYDVDKGGFLININDVHVPETDVSESTKRELRDLTEATLDKYFSTDTRYYDAWGVGRQDNQYMVQCQISDGSIFTDNWLFGCVWYEQQSDGTFKTIGVKIGDKYYEIK